MTASILAQVGAFAIRPPTFECPQPAPSLILGRHAFFRFLVPTRVRRKATAFFTGSPKPSMIGSYHHGLLV
ncbi:hypothetical protein [Chthonomonas calidirosea]|uniref:hypothetical protein n=1 Tax=Chthonomonas calidirosea TaxID=454171 RepID=UPI001E3D73D4|nr:hypothetical protein [Chthonomonas calidirosea]